jgi:hypothetical protein
VSSPDTRVVKRSVRHWLSATVIVAYFGVTLLWLPSQVLRLSFVGELDRTVRDLIGASVWIVFLVAGLWGLRAAQRRKLI